MFSYFLYVVICIFPKLKVVPVVHCAACFERNESLACTYISSKTRPPARSEFRQNAEVC